jgi:hypothetical protein
MTFQFGRPEEKVPFEVAVGRLRARRQAAATRAKKRLASPPNRNYRRNFTKGRTCELPECDRLAYAESRFARHTTICHACYQAEHRALKSADPNAARERFQNRRGY